MSKSVDQRVVEMRFDNRNFENNVKQTMSSLDKLKLKLNLPGAKTFEDIEKASSNVKMHGINNALDAVSNKFNVMSIVSITAIANLTNSAVNAGKRIADALTIRPIITGFNEYETKINAVQTILSNTAKDGTTMDDVTKSLGELNEYADKTIYNFAEMTKNIGTFTASGLGLEASTKAIQGIANVAAVSGSTSQQASTAMYQLSQALSSGVVHLTDWNSVVNAQMGGKVFQDAIIATASQVEGFDARVTEAYKSGVTFRQLLDANEYGDWFTSDILSTTLQKFTKTGAVEYVQQMSGATKDSVLELQKLGDTVGYNSEEFNNLANSILNGNESMVASAKDILGMAANAEDAATKVKTLTQLWDTTKEAVQSGWAQSWELVFGNFEEAKEFFSGLSDTIGGVITKFSDARNVLLGSALGTRWDDFKNKVTASGITLDNFQATLTDVSNQNGKDMTALIAQYGSFDAVMQSGEISASLITKTLSKMAAEGKVTADSVEGLGDKLSYFQKVVDDVWRGDYDNNNTAQLERFQKLEAAGYDYVKVQELVNSTVDGHRLTLEELSDAQFLAIGYTQEQIDEIRKLAKEAEKAGTPISKLIEDIGKPSGRELLLGSVTNILTAIGKVAKTVSKAFREIFPPITSQQIYDVIEKIHELTESLILSEESSLKLETTFKGLFAIIDVITTIVGGVFKFAISTINKLLGYMGFNILDVTAGIGGLAISIRDWVKEHNFINKALEKTAPYLEKIGNSIRTFVSEAKKADDTPTFIFNSIKKAISDMLTFVKDNLPKILNDIKTAIKNFFTKKPLIDSKSIGKKISNEMTASLQMGLTSPVDIETDKVTDKIKQMFTGLIAFVKKMDVGTILGVALTGGLLLTTNKFIKVLDRFANPFDSLSELFESFSSSIKKIGGGLGAMFKGIALEKKSIALKNFAISIAILAGSLWLLSKIPEDDLNRSLKAIGILSAILIALAVVVSKADTAVGFSLKGGPIIAAALSLLVIANAIKQLADVPTKDMVKSMAVLGLCIVGMLAVFKTLGLMMNGPNAKHMAKAGAMLLMMSISLIIMIGVIKLAGSLKYDEVLKGILVIVTIGLLFTTFVGVSTIAGEHAAKAGAMLLMMSIAMMIMVGTVKLASMLSPKEVLIGITTIGLIGWLFTTFIAVSALAGKNALRAGAMLLLMSFAFATMVGVVKLASMLSSDEIKRGMTLIWQVGGLFAVLIAVSKLAGNNALKAGAMLLMMSGAMIILVALIFILSKMDPEGVKRGYEAIAGIGVIFAGLIAVSKLATGSHKAIMSMTMSVLLLVAAVVALSLLDPDKVMNSALALSAVLIAFSILVLASKKMQNVNALKMLAPLLGLVAVVTLIGLVLYALGKLNIENALTNATAVSLLLVTMGASLLLIGNIPGTTSGSKLNAAVTSMMLMGVVLLEIAAVLWLMDTMNIQNGMKNVLALSVMLLAMTLSLRILATIPNTTPASKLAGAVGAMILMGVVLAEIGIVLGLLAAYNIEASIQNAIALSIVLLAMSGALVILSLIGTSGPAALAGVGILAALALVIGAAIWAFAEFVAPSLPEMAINLSLFGVALLPFLDAIRQVDDAALQGCVNIAAMMSALAVANVADAISSILGGDNWVSGIAASLNAFGEAMVDFSKIISGNIDVEAVNAAANAGMALAKLSENLPKEGGILEDFIGKKDMSAFGTQLSSFGESMVLFSEVVSGNIDEGAITAAANAGETLATMANKIPNEGGKLAEWLGDNVTDTWGTQLVSFANSMVDFSEIVAGNIDEGAVTAAANAGSALAAMSDEIPDSGGKLAEWLGDNVTDTWGTQLVSFANSMVDFSKIITGNIDADAVVAAAKAGEALAAMNEKLPDSGGKLAEIFGDNTVDVFGTQLVLFGKSMVEFSKVLVEGGIDEAAITAAAKSGEALAVMANTLPESGGWMTKMFKGNNIEEFSLQLASFGSAMVNFSNSILDINTASMSIAPGVIESFSKSVGAMPEQSNLKKVSKLKNLDDVKTNMTLISDIIASYSTSVSEIKMDNMETATEQFTKLVNALSVLSTTNFGETKSFSDTLISIGQTAVDEFINTFKNAYTKASDTCKMLVSKMTDAINNNSNTFVNEGTTMMDKFANSIRNAKYKITLAVKEVIDNAVYEAWEMYETFSNLGEHLANGFVKGIDATNNKVEEAVTGLVLSAKSAATRNLLIQSPSRVFMQYGVYTGEGFINGLDSMNEGVYSSSKSMADSAKKGIRGAIEMINNLLNSDLSTIQPTIAPVMDLNNIRSGMSTIQNMINSNRAIPNMNAVNTIAKNNVTTANQNGVIREVVSAVNQLRHDLNNVPRNTYTINGITYDDGTNISNAIQSLIHETVIDRRL